MWATSLYSVFDSSQYVLAGKCPCSHLMCGTLSGSFSALSTYGYECYEAILFQSHCQLHTLYNFSHSVCIIIYPLARLYICNVMCALVYYNVLYTVQCPVVYDHTLPCSTVSLQRIRVHPLSMLKPCIIKYCWHTLAHTLYIMYHYHICPARNFGTAVHV